MIAPVVTETVVLDMDARLTDHGLILPNGLPFGEWLSTMAKLFTLQKFSWWYIGDGLAYGEQQYGEKYAQALALSEATGMSVDSIRSAQWVAERVPVVTRVTSLSWTHHRLVAALDPDEQRALLAKATEHDWSTREMEDAVRNYKHALANPDSPERPKKKAADEAPVEFDLGITPLGDRDAEAIDKWGTAEENQPEVDPLEELEAAHDEIEKLTAELESLEKDDSFTEIRKLHARVAGLEGRLRQEMARANEAVRQAKWQGRILRELRDLFRVESSAEIKACVLELLQQKRLER